MIPLVKIKEGYRGFFLRQKDLDAHILFLKQIEDSLLETSHNKTAKKHVLKIHRAQSYMLAYNLMEYVFNFLAECCETSLKKTQLKFEELEVKTQNWIISLHRNAIYLTGKGDISKEYFEDMIKLSWDAGKRLEKYPKSIGNWDFIKAKGYFANFGWKWSPSDNWWEVPITKTICDRRNELAHGDGIFSEMGKDLTAVQLEKDFQEIEKYLLKMIKSIFEFCKVQI